MTAQSNKKNSKKKNSKKNSKTISKVQRDPSKPTKAQTPFQTASDASKISAASRVDRPMKVDIRGSSASNVLDMIAKNKTSTMHALINELVKILSHVSTLSVEIVNAQIVKSVLRDESIVTDAEDQARQYMVQARLLLRQFEDTLGLQPEYETPKNVEEYPKANLRVEPVDF